ncbi:MAG: NAD(P)/FAD-dependent oxidoreductase [Acidobacteriota bacterium]|nr:NAD(P)/FAD-dependent oxidoreductase [Acidobacteriota bacterium]
MNSNYEVLIIGGGVVGCAIARELSKYNVKTALIEKEADVSMGASCRNSGVCHAGFKYKPGSMRAVVDVKGNAMMDDLCRDLKVKMKRIGKLTVALSAESATGLHKLKEQGDANGVPGLRVLDKDEMQKIQPGVQGVAALHSPSSAIVSPYNLTIGLAENALANGVNFHLGQEVTAIEKKSEGGFAVRCKSGDTFETKVLINSAGLYAAHITDMLGITEFKIYPSRGEYYILDKRLNGTVKCLIYPVQEKSAALGGGGGAHLTPTVDGNILIGPTAQYVDDPEDYACTADVMAQLRREGQALLPAMRGTDFIRNFAGSRAKQTPPGVGGNADFIIEDRKDVKGFINLMGIESPGLTSSPAIAEMVAGMVGGHLTLTPDPAFNPVRPGMVDFFEELSPEEKADLIAKDPNYGEIICRCEKITKKEVLDAIQNPLGARTLVSIKYRGRASMGRCQGGFCVPRIVRLLRDEFGWKPEDFLERGKTSPMFVGNVRPKGGQA